MPQPWDQDYQFTPNRKTRRRPSIRSFVGKIAEIVFVSGIVYAAVLKHHYNVNRKNS